MTIADMKKMTFGAVVDFCVEYNNRYNKKDEKPVKRKATQDDINAFFGG